MQAFLIALQFLTRLPVHLPDTPGEQDIGRSLLYYPLVGLLLGFTLAALAWA
ncbi:MAG: adenosylcobinamide-GDP ribazoletransferase, partial [Candidatus Acidiferrales bacterium]